DPRGSSGAGNRTVDRARGVHLGGDELQGRPVATPASASLGAAAGELYPDIRYTSVSEYLDRLLPTGSAGRNL
ncbi:unnamed protein product, partial [Urochloa humidicola]